jgi:hypothetical protein
VILGYEYCGSDGWATYTREGRFGHTEAVLSNAANEDLQRRWPIDTAYPRAVVKLGPAASSADSGAPAKRAAAAVLGSLLSAPDPSRTQGRASWFTTTCTTGSQLDAVAGCLLSEGRAAHVEVLVLARPPGADGPARRSGPEPPGPGSGPAQEFVVVTGKCRRPAPCPRRVPRGSAAGEAAGDRDGGLPGSGT